MGIYFNNKLVAPKENGDEVEAMYYEGLEKINVMLRKNNSIVLVRDVVRTPDSKGQSFRAVVPFALPSEVPIYLKELGAVSIRYSPGSPQRQGKELVWPTYRNFMYDRMILTKKNRDLAWFLLIASNFVENKNDPDSNRVIRIYDPEKNILDKASEVKRIAQIDVLLMNEESSVYNIGSMQNIADRFGVNIENFKVEAAGFTIREAVIDADNKKNPDFNIKALLKYAKGLKVVEKDPEDTGDKKYTQDELSIMFPPELALISDKLRTQKVPAVKKVEQIRQILEAQKILEEA